MNKLILYVHGKGGEASESLHYVPLFPDADVLGFDYKAENPWEAREEFRAYFASVCAKYDSVEIIANSIGAFFCMHSLSDLAISHAYFISPIVDMEKLITDMMLWANVTEEQLIEKKRIETSFGETLSIDYLNYVRNHQLQWAVPTDILYGEKDSLTTQETMACFAANHQASLTILENGEHWFHTKEQMDYLDQWLLGHRR